MISNYDYTFHHETIRDNLNMSIFLPHTKPTPFGQKYVEEKNGKWLKEKEKGEW